MSMEKRYLDDKGEPYYNPGDDHYEESLIGAVSPYTTSDLGCAAALYCRGFQPLELNRSDPHRVLFEFQRTSDVISVVAAYWDNTLPVDAQSYFGAIKHLKNRLHSGE